MFSESSMSVIVRCWLHHISLDVFYLRSGIRNWSQKRDRIEKQARGQRNSQRQNFDSFRNAVPVRIQKYLITI